MVSDKATALWLCRKELPQRQKAWMQSIYEDEKTTVPEDRHVGRLREKPWLAPTWQLIALTRAISSEFPLANPYDLPGSESIFVVSQGPPMFMGGWILVCESLSQDGFCCKSPRVEPPLKGLPFGLQGAFSVHARSRRSPDFGNEEYVRWGDLVRWLKDERADKTKEGLGTQGQKTQSCIIFPSPVL